MKTPKQILAEMEKGCGNWANDTLVETEYSCGEKDKRENRIHYCSSCNSKISTSKERWKEELEFLEKKKQQLEEMENEITDNLGFEEDEFEFIGNKIYNEINKRIAELKEVLR